MATKKMTINELRKLVRQIIKEENSSIKRKILKEGAELSIDGFNNDKEDLETVGDISYAILKHLVHNGNPELDTSSITPDGGYYSEETGIINFYLGKKYTDMDRLQSILISIKEFCKKNNIVLGKMTAEHYKEGDSTENIRVIRIPVIENNAFKAGFQHKIHLGYTTIYRIFRDVLGFPLEKNEYVFHFDVDDILYKIKNLNHFNVPDDLDEFINVIAKMADYAKENGFKTISGA